jgi:hypothetical protein
MRVLSLMSCSRCCRFIIVIVMQESPIEIALEKMMVFEYGDFGEAPWI